MTIMNWSNTGFPLRLGVLCVQKKHRKVRKGTKTKKFVYFGEEVSSPSGKETVPAPKS